MSSRRSFGYIRKLPSGSFQASYVSPEGHRIYAPTTFQRKVEADLFLSKIRTEIAFGTWTNKPPRHDGSKELPSLAELLEDYLNRKIGPSGDILRQNTKDLYSRLFRNHLSHLASTRVDHIQQSHLEQVYASLLRDGKKTTASKVYKLAKGLLSWAIRQGYLIDNPLNIRGAGGVNTGLERHVPTRSQINELIPHMPRHHAELALVLALCGLRFSEGIALRVGDLAVKSDGRFLLSISRAITRSDGKLILGAPKSKASRRRIPIPSEAGEILLLKTQELRRGLCFREPDGSVVSYFGFRRSLNLALKNAGLTHLRITPHSFRDFGATSLANAGANVTEIGSWIGDASLNSVLRYVKDTERMQYLIEKI